MKKFYVLVVVCLFYGALLNGQTNYFWVGPAAFPGGNWNSAANWSATSGGAGGFGVPNNIAHRAIFNQNAYVNVNITSITLSSLQVLSSRTARLVANNGAFTSITLNSNDVTNPGLRIDASSRLEDSAATGDFEVSFANGARGRVDGTWYFAGTGGLFAYFLYPTIAGQGNRIDVNNGGSLVFKNNSFIPSDITGDQYIFMNSGSLMQIDINGGNIPIAVWDPNSTVRITGNTTNGTGISETSDLGNLIYDCPNLIASPQVSLGLVNINVRGNLDVLNTNGALLVISGNGSFSTTSISNTVFGNFTISGNSRVVISNVDANNKTVTFQINGNLNAGGLSFDMQRNSNGTIGSNTTTVLLRGNLNHTAGTFAPTATAVATPATLYVLELNGSSNQNISSVTGSIDNANNQVTLRMNNPAGATLLTPLSVARIDFSTANQGILRTTAANVLTINNINFSSVNGGSDAGYVQGPVRRRTLAGAAYVFPTGKAGNYRFVEVIPQNASLSTYEAEYFAPQTDPDVVPPLLGVTDDEYWVVNRIAGSNAQIQLNLEANPGSGATDLILVAWYNGASWQNAFGGTGTTLSGNSSSGTVRSQVRTVFGSFTFAWASAGSLDINLLTFNAKKLSNTSALVNWKITDESTPQGFEVLKSTDGRNFNSIGSVSGIDKKVDYDFTDRSLKTGTSYYRLRMIDISGKVSLTKIIAVVNGGKGVLVTSVLPTIVTNTAMVNITSAEKGNIQLVVTDMHGRIVHQQITSIAEGNQQVMLSTNRLASGTYQVSGYFDGERCGTIRFIKQ